MDIKVMKSPTSKMSKKISNRLLEISSNKTLINTLFDLHDKWKHSNSKTDFNEYSVMIMRILRDIDNKIHFIKVTTKPLGFQFVIDNRCVHVFVKGDIKGNNDDILIGMKLV